MIDRTTVTALFLIGYAVPNAQKRISFARLFIFIAPRGLVGHVALRTSHIPCVHRALGGTIAHIEDLYWGNTDYPTTV